MPDLRVRPQRGAGRALALLAALIILAALAPLLANDRPLLARAGGRIVAPALRDLISGLLGLPEPVPGPWLSTGAQAEVLLRAPVPYSYRGIHLDEALRPPGGRHLLGTDALGRDLLARLIHGTRPAMVVGFGATAIALLLGTLLGALAGLRGGAIDLLVMRIADVIACFPSLVLALSFVAAAGHGGIGPMLAAIALSRWTGTARYVRGEIMRQAGSDLWAAARAAGSSLPRLALRHLLPLFAPTLGVMAAFGVAHAIVLESGMSFVGLGIDPPAPSWGLMLAESRATLDAAWWPVFFPAAALLLVLGALCVAAERIRGGERGTDLAFP